MWQHKLRDILKLIVAKQLANYSTATKLKEVDIENIRNIGILAHIDAGTYAFYENMCLVKQIETIYKIDYYFTKY